MADAEKSFKCCEDLDNASTDVDEPYGQKKHKPRFWDRFPFGRTPHVCSSHHNHKTREDMESCNEVRKFQLEQEKRLHQEEQKLAEMDKMIQFAKKRQEHLVRKNDILHELSENSPEREPRAKMLKANSENSQSETHSGTQESPRDNGLDLKTPEDLQKVKEALDTCNTYDQNGKLSDVD